MQGNRGGDRNNDKGGRDRRPQNAGQGRSQGSQGRNQGAGAGRPQSNGARPVSPANPYRPLIKPSVKPQPVTNDYGNRNRAQANNNRAAAAAQAAAKQEAAKEAAREAAAKAAAAESAVPVNRDNRVSDVPRANNGERRSEQRSGERSQF